MAGNECIKQAAGRKFLSAEGFASPYSGARWLTSIEANQAQRQNLKLTLNSERREVERASERDGDRRKRENGSDRGIGLRSSMHLTYSNNMRAVCSLQIVKQIY